MSNKSRKTTRKNEDPVAVLLKKADKHIDKFEYDLALQYCERALQLNPDSVQALETSSSLLLESGEVDKAKLRLERAVELFPNDGHAKFLSLAQLCDAMEALKFYKYGIDIIKKKLDTLDEQINNDEKKLLLRELSTAHCSVAELFTTDLCDDDDAETECLASIKSAIEMDPTNPEAFQAKANFLLIKEDFEGAKIAMNESLSLWLPKMRDIMQGTSETSDPFEVCPVPYVTRIAAVKSLVELTDYEPAAEVLEGLLTEDDEVVEVWYLSGFMNYLRGEDFFGNARFYLNKAKEVATKITADEPEMLQHVDEILSEIGPGDEDDDEFVANKGVGNIDGDDDEYEDISTSSDDDKENAMETKN